MPALNRVRWCSVQASARAPGVYAPHDGSWLAAYGAAYEQLTRATRVVEDLARAWVRRRREGDSRG